MAVDTTVSVVMPAMGDSVSEGTVLEWLKAEGDTVSADEALVEISTDKVDAEVPSPAGGMIVKIHARTGDTVAVGDVLCEIGGGEAGNGAAPAAPAVGEQEIDIIVPAMGESVSEGVILEWLKQAGDGVAEDEGIVEVSTDKVDAELPSPASGVMIETLAEVGETVTVGQIVARMRGEAPVPSNGVAAATTEGALAQPAPADPTGTRGSGPPGAAREQSPATPVAKRMAAVEGVDLSSITGTGPHGRITKRDVWGSREAARGQSTPTEAAPAVAATPLRGGAATLARYMDESRQIPTATSLRTMTVTTLDGRRQQLKEAGHRVSFTHLIAYAIAVAATEQMPVMARHFLSVGGKPHVVDDEAVNLGIAVDVQKRDASRTLMVPVIRDAGRLSFEGFLHAFADLIARARENTLTADDLQGANLSLTNPGGLGTVASVPRLMNGQGTIVATGSIAYPVGLGNIGALIGAEKVMTMTSTYDHRIIQGAESGRFLQTVEAYLQGEHGFYERVFGDLGVPLGAAPQPPAPAAGAAVARDAVAPAPSGPSQSALDEELLQGVQAATSLIKAHRTHGHLAARLDPLGSEPEGDPALDPDPLGLTPELMARIPAKILRVGVPGATLADALPHLRETYCGTIAYEIEHLASHRQRVWLRKAIEAGEFRAPLTTEEKKALLGRLTQVDSLERFMHKAYLGQKQFSIEGLDMTVPILDELTQLAYYQGAREVVIGMAHRGRLNVLAHNLGRAYETIFREFEGASSIEAVTTIPQGGTGDVKYHHGAQGTYQIGDGSVLVRLESNPSHLEYVAPVVTGATRAAQTTRQGPRTHIDHAAAMPIVLHGDAAFPGQGVVSETLNLQGLDGYTVGGTVHLIQNNQVGFTTDPDESRSTRWASDLAKGFDVPIIHVNADDVAACIAAVRLAFAFRQEFGHDVLIDLIGYRRWGHNETDEPAYTQPEMAVKIKAKTSVREIFAAQLVADGTVTQQEADAIGQERWDRLSTRHRELKDELAHSQTEQPTGGYQLDRTQSPEVKTAVSAERLLQLNADLLRVPEGFTMHPKLQRQLERRREVAETGRGIDWAHAEALAYASLLSEGTPIRLTGQDVERGTFSQRHLVFHDTKTGYRASPIQNLPGALAPMELHNSPLSEVACLGFEYGYSMEAPESLVLWEAQFGDFANAAQVIIDQFIISALAKWGQTSRLTLLLPHGYEGSGPEHSSARLERFLQLAAEGNMRVANLTTPAQYFHLLRRQARVAKQRPLVIVTPKQLLRLPQAMSQLAHLSDSRFYPVLSEPRIDEDKVKRLVFCTGKVFYDLKGHTTREDNPGVAISRVELLYPFPQAQILEEIARYPNLREVVWAQEEPRNMGARAHMSPRMLQILPDQLEFGYVGRPERASPGEGYPAAHTIEQNRIIRTALDLDIPPSVNPARAPGER